MLNVVIAAVVVAGGVVAVPAQASAADVRTTWSRSFARLDLSGPAGVAVVPLDGHPGVSIGSWTNGPAWSTIKVPLSIAALKRSTSSTTQARVRSAIRASDNEAAKKLWAGLGSPTTAAKRVEAVLRPAGDPNTVVQHRQVRPPYTSFGQTRWRLGDQARFAANISCTADGKTVRSHMGHVVASQRFGLSRIRGARYKGGWGPDGKRYLVRQVAVVTRSDGTRYGVAAAVSASSFERGKQDLDRIGRWVAPRLSDLKASPCP